MIDISKAYDRLKWDYIVEVMTKMGFEPVWVDGMRLCITTVSYSVLMNEDLVGQFIPRRGLRQGDPVSPYLLIIGTEGLSSLINQAVSRGEVHGIKVCRGAPEVTHLLFADDSLFFFKAGEYECLKRQNILTKYGQDSSEAINLQKSGLLFSKNVEGTRTIVENIMGIRGQLNTGRYLGLPSLIGKSKRLVFGF